MFKQFYDEALEQLYQSKIYRGAKKTIATIMMVLIGYVLFAMFCSSSVFAAEEQTFTSQNSIGSLSNFFEYQELSGINYSLRNTDLEKIQVDNLYCLSMSPNETGGNDNYVRKMDDSFSLNELTSYYWSNVLWETVNNETDTNPLMQFFSGYVTNNGTTTNLFTSGNMYATDDVNSSGYNYKLELANDFNNLNTYSPFSLYTITPNWENDHSVPSKMIQINKNDTQDIILYTSDLDDIENITTENGLNLTGNEYDSTYKVVLAKSEKYYNASNVSEYLVTYDDNNKYYFSTKNDNYNNTYETAIVEGLKLWASQHQTELTRSTDANGKTYNTAGFSTASFYENGNVFIWDDTRKTFNIYQYSNSDTNTSGKTVIFDANDYVKYTQMFEAILYTYSVTETLNTTTYNSLNDAITNEAFNNYGIDGIKDNDTIYNGNDSYTLNDLAGYLVKYTYNWTYESSTNYKYENTYKQLLYYYCLNATTKKYQLEEIKTIKPEDYDASIDTISDIDEYYNGKYENYDEGIKENDDDTITYVKVGSVKDDLYYVNGEASLDKSNDTSYIKLSSKTDNVIMDNSKLEKEKVSIAYRDDNGETIKIEAIQSGDDYYTLSDQIIVENASITFEDETLTTYREATLTIGEPIEVTETEVSEKTSNYENGRYMYLQFNKDYSIQNQYYYYTDTKEAPLESFYYKYEIQLVRAQTLEDVPDISGYGSEYIGTRDISISSSNRNSSTITSFVDLFEDNASKARKDYWSGDDYIYVGIPQVCDLKPGTDCNEIADSSYEKGETLYYYHSPTSYYCYASLVEIRRIKIEKSQMSDDTWATSPLTNEKGNSDN